MTYHIYTFGSKSKQFLILKPHQAQTVNDFTECFFRSQENFLEQNGRRWTPDEPLPLLVPDSDPRLLKRYNELVTRLNRQHSIRNRAFDFLHINLESDDMDDFLVKRI